MGGQVFAGHPSVHRVTRDSQMRRDVVDSHPSLSLHFPPRVSPCAGSGRLRSFQIYRIVSVWVKRDPPNRRNFWIAPAIRLSIRQTLRSVPFARRVAVVVDSHAPTTRFMDHRTRQLDRAALRYSHGRTTVYRPGVRGGRPGRHPRPTQLLAPRWQVFGGLRVLRRHP